jgi:glucose-1-phosphate cytidylyltransferase
MKVVLFCGGEGLRMREASETMPKPMVPIGSRPILWHVMKYYAYFGHTEFVLCLGHKAEVVKNFFLHYEEALSNDFVLSRGGKRVDLISSDIGDWEITFVNTGLHCNVGERLRAVRRFVEGEEMFLANYGDVLTDAPLPLLIARAAEAKAVASLLCVRPSYSFHVVSTGEDEHVRRITDVRQADIWINGGYFVLRPQIFDFMEEGNDLVDGPFQRLAERGLLLAQRYEGFWAPMDTLKDKRELEALHEAGRDPWRVWGLDGNGSARATPPAVVP